MPRADLENCTHFRNAFPWWRVALGLQICNHTLHIIQGESVIPNSLEKEILIEAPVKYVWQALTDTDQLMEWFPNEATLDLRPGGAGKFTWHDRAAVQEKSGTSAWLQVESVDEPTSFTFRWGHPEGTVATPANSVLVAFTLTELDEEQTRVHVVESGFTEIEWSESDTLEYIDDHKKGWEKHLADLRVYVTRQANA
jgi:uncharacterized protein YndB with AHSA1/START domain